MKTAEKEKTEKLDSKSKATAGKRNCLYHPAMKCLKSNAPCVFAKTEKDGNK